MIKRRSRTRGERYCGVQSERRHGSRNLQISSSRQTSSQHNQRSPHQSRRPVRLAHRTCPPSQLRNPRATVPPPLLNYDISKSHNLTSPPPSSSFRLIIEAHARRSVEGSGGQEAHKGCWRAAPEEAEHPERSCGFRRPLALRDKGHGAAARQPSVNRWHHCQLQRHRLLGGKGKNKKNSLNHHPVAIAIVIVIASNYLWCGCCC